MRNATAPTVATNMPSASALSARGRTRAWRQRGHRCHWNARPRTAGAAGDYTRHRLRGLADVPGLRIPGFRAARRRRYQSGEPPCTLVRSMRKLIRIQTNRTLSAIGPIGILLLSVAYFPALAADAEKSPPVKIAVFDFELEDVSAAASLPGETVADSTRLKDVTSEARRVLAQSGRYSLIDVSRVDAKPVTEKSLRNCNGCENSIA